MRKSIIFLLFTFILIQSISVQSTTLYRLTFDNSTPGLIPDAYSPAGFEFIYPASIISSYNYAGDTAQIVLTNSISTLGISQGGNAIKVDAFVTAGSVTTNCSEGMYVIMPNAIAPGSLTIEYIAKFDIIHPPGNTAGIGTIGDTEWPFAPGFNWMLRTQSSPSTNLLRFNTDREGEGSYVQTFFTDTTMWHHFAGVFSYDTVNPANSSVSFYVDTTLIGSATYDASSIVYSLGNYSNIGVNTWTIGWGHSEEAGLHGDHRGLQGAIDAVAISDTALVPSTFVLMQPPPTAKAPMWKED